MIFCVEHGQLQELSNIQAIGGMQFPCDPMAMAGSPFSSSFSNGSNGSKGSKGQVTTSRHDFVTTFGVCGSSLGTTSDSEGSREPHDINRHMESVGWVSTEFTQTRYIRDGDTSECGCPAGSLKIKHFTN